MAEKNKNPLVTTICSPCKTPKIKIRYSTLVKPFYYYSSPTIPRYSITCIFDPKENKEIIDFVKGMQSIEKNEKVDTCLKRDFWKSKEGKEVYTGLYTIKFQSRDLIPVYIFDENGKPTPVELEEELKKNAEVVVVYNILRYTKRNSLNGDHGLSLKPSCIYLHTSENE